MNNTILLLPDEVLDNVLSYVAYDEISHLRLVNKRFDAACQRVLNQGFYKVEKFHAQCLRRVKEQLPRRESERRKHPLAAHCDILTAIETRLSLLGMTFMKYVDLKYCCFIPGKVLDEIFKILRYISNAPTPPRSHEILQELRDISSMAMEHFDEKIAPAFRNRRNAAPKLAITSSGALTGKSQLFLNTFYDNADTYFNISSQHFYGVTGSPTFRSPSATHELVKINLGYRQLQSKYVELRKENIDCRRRLMEYRKKLHDLDRKFNEQNAFILEQTNRISEQDSKISELSRKFMEFDKNMADTIIDLKHEQESPVDGEDDKSASSSAALCAEVLPQPVEQEINSVPESSKQNTLPPPQNDAEVPVAKQDSDTSLARNDSDSLPPKKNTETNTKPKDSSPQKRHSESHGEPRKKRIRLSKRTPQ